MFAEPRLENVYLQNRIPDVLGIDSGEDVMLGGAAVAGGTHKVFGCNFGVVGAMFQ